MIDHAPLLPLMLSQLAAASVVALVVAAATERLVHSPLLGGLIAGLLLSSAVAGRWLPDLHERLFRGGVAEQAAVDAKYLEQAELREALASTGVTEAALVEFDAKADAELQTLRDAMTAARQRHAVARDVGVALVVIAWLVLAGASTPVGRLLPHLRDALPIAIGCMVSVAVLAAVGATLLGRMQAGTQASGWFAGLMLVCMAGAAPMAGGIRRQIHRPGDMAVDDPAGLTEATAFLLVLIVLVITALVLPHASGEGAEPAATNAVVHLGDALAAIALIVLALFALRTLLAQPQARPWVAPVMIAFAAAGAWLAGLPGLVVAFCAGLSLASSASGRLTDTVRGHVLETVLTPVAAALLAMSVSFEGWSWWLLLVVLVAAGDGKALGMWMLGRLFAGRSWGRSMRMGAALSIAGLLPVVLAWVMRGRGMIDEPLFAAAMMAALVLELLARPLLAVLRLEADAAD